MEILRVRSDGGEELLTSGLSSAESEELRDWFRYTKPMDHSMRILVRGAPDGDSAFSVTGSESDQRPDPAAFHDQPKHIQRSRAERHRRIHKACE
jgi:hypothetical protein